MELVNATKMIAGYTLGLNPDGRESVVVVVKGTFALPVDGREASLAEEQAPLVMADQFAGEPGFSAMVYESEFAPEKPRCDVLLNGSAYAPRGHKAKRVNVRMRVGPIDKSFDVLGTRSWDRVLGLAVASRPKPFTRQPFDYGTAFGGQDVHPKNPKKAKMHLLNPFGVGYYPYTRGKALVGKRLSNTAAPGSSAKTPTGRYKPMAFGPIGRNFKSRYPLAGTYDKDWLDNVAPFLPADFDPLYFQSAPEEQQMPYPKGGERVELTNLTPRGRTVFELPRIEVPLEFTNADYERTEVRAVMDTVIIEPDLERFMVVWRGSHPLKRNMLEMRQCVVGRMSSGWYRARGLGKEYYPSLVHLIDER